MTPKQTDVYIVVVMTVMILIIFISLFLNSNASVWCNSQADEKVLISVSPEVKNILTVYTSGLDYSGQCKNFYRTDVSFITNGDLDAAQHFVDAQTQESNARIQQAALRQHQQEIMQQAIKK